MTGLDQAIRARLDEFCESDMCAEVGKAALLAVLDLHKPRSAGIPKKPHIADCSVCMDVGPEVCSPVGYPCETVEAIAEKLGVEADGG